MSDKNGSAGKNGSEKPDVEALRAEIRQTRADLGETVQALAAKADVKARAKEQVEETKQKVKAQAAEAGQKALGAAHAASERIRGAAAAASDRARDAAPADKVQDARAEVQRNPFPYALAIAGVVAAIGVILVVRGRRR